MNAAELDDRLPWCGTLTTRCPTGGHDPAASVRSTSAPISPGNTMDTSSCRSSSTTESSFRTRGRSHVAVPGCSTRTTTDPHDHLITGANGAPGNSASRRVSDQCRAALGPRYGNPLPDLSRPEITQDSVRAANVVRIGMRDGEIVQPRDAKGQTAGTPAREPTSKRPCTCPAASTSNDRPFGKRITVASPWSTSSTWTRSYGAWRSVVSAAHTSPVRMDASPGSGAVSMAAPLMVTATSAL